jgi:hypothetical protein
MEVIPIHVKAVRRMRRQPSIVVRLFNQVFGAATLTVKPDYEVDRILHVGHKDPVFVLAGLEQLVLESPSPVPPGFAEVGVPLNTPVHASVRPHALKSFIPHGAQEIPAIHRFIRTRFHQHWNPCFQPNGIGHGEPSRCHFSINR